MSAFNLKLVPEVIGEHLIQAFIQKIYLIELKKKHEIGNFNSN